MATDEPTGSASTVALIVEMAAAESNDDIERLMDEVYAEEILGRDGSLGVTGAEVRAFIEFRNRVKDE